MTVFARYRDDEGRECVVYRPSTLEEAELNYRSCGAESPDDEEEPVTEHAIRHDDEVVRILHAGGGHLDTTGQALSKRAAGGLLDRFAQEHLRRHPGCSYREAFEVAKKLNPEITGQYAAMPQSVEDHLRRQPGRAYAVDDGVATYHVSGGPARAYGSVNRSDLLAPGDGIRVRWRYDPAIGDQVPDQLTFSKVQFPHRGAVDVWLQRRGLVPAAVEERFDAFVATLFDPAAPSPDRVGDRVLARAGARALAQGGGGDVKERLREAIRQREEASAEEVLLQMLGDQTTRQQLVPLLIELLELE